MNTTPKRGALNEEFENLNLQMQEVKTLLQAVQHQHEETYLLGDQLSGIARLLSYVQKDMETIQARVDDIDAWGQVNYKRLMEAGL